LLRVVTMITRVVLASAFVPSGLVKILDQPFTTLPTTDPVGYFFAGFFSAHAYYRFIRGGTVDSRRTASHSADSDPRRLPLPADHR
jgi:hypothetical protein